jgi:hypothetical protein
MGGSMIGPQVLMAGKVMIKPLTKNAPRRC